MSNIAMQGGATGTGTVTLLAPSTSTDRTLTLPDATGTVLVSGNGISGTTGTFSGDLSFNSGYGSAAVGYGCRAWVNFNGTGTVAIRASGNVSSITDNGTGDYTVNFATALPDVNYGFACCSTNGASGNSIPSSFSLATILAASFRLIDARPTGAVDRDTFTAVFFR